MPTMQLSTINVWKNSKMKSENMIVNTYQSHKIFCGCLLLLLMLLLSLFCYCHKNILNLKFKSLNFALRKNISEYNKFYIMDVNVLKMNVITKNLLENLLSCNIQLLMFFYYVKQVRLLSYILLDYQVIILSANEKLGVIYQMLHFHSEYIKNEL